MPEANDVRGLTDESLRAERGKTDAELAVRRLTSERSADAVVLRARDNADEVLQSARDTADAHRSTRAPGLAGERALADGVLERERSAADARVQHERDERKRALASLLQLEREETDQHLLTERDCSDEALNTRDIFLAMVSHDLRTMLGGIAMTAELLAHDAPGETAVLARAETIQRFSARMNRLIGDLVDVASIEAGKLVMAMAPGDLRSVAAEAVETHRPLAASRSILLTLEPCPAPVPAAFDRERLFQVIGNLISNAVKFSGSGASIRVRAGLCSGEARVTVADSGPGIRAENLKPIFERFWQVGRRDRRGLGLGLYISRCIIEAHGGRIWAESAGHSGSTFVFALPERRG